MSQAGMMRFLEGRRLYRAFDSDIRGFIELKDLDEAKFYNEKGFGCYCTTQAFEAGAPRKIAHCSRVLSWAVDIDAGTKMQMHQAIDSLGIEPTWTVETKRGVQVYYDAVDGTFKNFPLIMRALVECLGGDKNAKDLARVLRVPGFYHWKDRNDPFLVKLIYGSTAKNTENEMMRKLQIEPVEPLKLESRKIVTSLKPHKNSFWKMVSEMDCEKALTRLSGTAYVNYESYSFRPLNNGTKTIFVNGKSTSCWIDRVQRIGSLDKGGPSVFDWIHWIHRDKQKTCDILKMAFPELAHGG